MMDTLARLFDTSGFLAHGHCFLWAPSLLWSYVISDSIIAASYYSVPFALWYFVKRRRDLPYRWVFIMFGIFVMACGTTHLFAIWNIWEPHYWADAGVKAVTAAVSAATAVLLWPLLPHALAIPGQQQLKNKNRELQNEIQRRMQAEETLWDMNSLLEERVARRTDDLRKANDSLASSNMRLQAAIDSANMAMFEWDFATGRMEWLGGHGTLPGHFADEFGDTYDAFAKCVHPDDLKGLREGIGRCIDQHLRFVREYRIIRPDGSIHWRACNGRIRYAGDDRAAAMLGAVMDITERKLTDETRLRLAEIVESSEDAIIGSDLNGIVTSWNAGAEKIYGYRADEVVGRPIATVVPPAAQSEIRELFEKVTRGEPVIHHETRRTRKEGGDSDVSLTLSPIRDGGGRLVGISTIARDISGQKRAERSLRRINRALKVLSGCNGVLVRAGNEEQMLEEMCRIIVETGEYRLAWVGFAEQDAQKTVRPVAQRGYEEGYMQQARITWADTEQGSGPVGAAIRTQQPQIIQNVHTDPMFAPWRANALKIGYGSVIALPLTSFGQTLGAVSIHSVATDAFDEEEIRLLSELADDFAFGITALRARAAHEQSARRLQDAMESTIQAIAATVEMRDPYTAGHQCRVAELSRVIAQEMGLPESEIRGIHLAGIVHDLGKIQVPAEILSRPGRLTETEYALIKNHPQAGYDILQEVNFPWPIAQMVLQHHERLDGSGYPNGLKAAEILLGAKILAVADTVEAMASHRPYRPSLGIDAALEEIQKNRERLYDGAVVDACARLFTEKRFTFSR